ncbi:MAG: hypothetical protein H6736_12965 [Alphaproteobacteria bacterium]|nr:hypothetical protein [Alphaproteobacteria bacterium]MCB9692714.1 hypothetical protein [Alphaproteobacteria bacterium]
MIALVSLALGAPALESGNTAHTLAQADSKLTLGVFRPWSFRVDEKTDLVTTGVIGSLVAPRLDVKRRIYTQGDDVPLTASFVAGVNSPTPVLNLAKGWVQGTADRLPFAMQLKAGLLASRQAGRARLTMGAELKVGVATGANDYTPRDLYFMDWALAPLVEGPIAAHLKLQGDLLATDSLLFTAELHLQATGSSTELASRWFALWGFSDHAAVGAGYFTHLDLRPDGYHHYFVPGADFQLRY